ncbi:Hypothetical predicted protein [Olea europaea subsp. europaea]|uniref:Uncharacterized protein n=1 Tax=Olea europaea subsp. europaea TaxID=158383 RepID=A0A8S0QTJ1_OLEEU|nr:Hypothetical predicted protein [Olea europaea subsp. europaea]
MELHRCHPCPFPRLLHLLKITVAEGSSSPYPTPIDIAIVVQYKGIARDHDFLNKTSTSMYNYEALSVPSPFSHPLTPLVPIFIPHTYWWCAVHCTMATGIATHCSDITSYDLLRMLWCK